MYARQPLTQVPLYDQHTRTHPTYIYVGQIMFTGKLTSSNFFTNCISLFMEALSPVANGLWVDSCSLMSTSRPSMVVNLPPRVPGCMSNSSSGIDSEAVSDWKKTCKLHYPVITWLHGHLHVLNYMYMYCTSIHTCIYNISEQRQLLLPNVLLSGVLPTAWDKGCICTNIKICKFFVSFIFGF